jgi:ABC-type nitrate/sulfonate/bicarbonate transport system substrate-binding protein
MRGRWTSRPRLGRGWGLLLLTVLLALPVPAPRATAAADHRAGDGSPGSATRAAAPGTQGLSPARVAMQYIISDAGLLIADDYGYMREAGIDFQALRADNLELQTAMAQGLVDVGGIGVTAAVLNAHLRGVRLRIVADRATITPGHGYVAVVVRKDLVDSGEVRGVRDLRGRKVAQQPPLYATTSWALFDRLLQMNGLSDSDLENVGLGFADQNAGLAGRTIDAAVQTEPGVTAAVGSGLAVRLAGFDEVITPFSLGGLAYSEPFTAQTDVARRFMVAYLRGVRAYLDAFTKNVGRPEAVAVLVRETALKDPALYDRIVLPYIDPDGVFGLNGYQEVQEYFVRHGTLPQTVDLTQLLDPSFAQYAAQQLGPYR